MTKTRAPLWVEAPTSVATQSAEDGDCSSLPRGRRPGVLTARPPAPADSLLHRQGRSWAEIARFVGQRNLSLTADTYTHVLSDGREVDYANVLA